MIPKNNRFIIVLAVAIIAIVVIGEVAIYCGNGLGFDAKATYNDNHLDYEISSGGSKDYSVLLFDDDGFGLSENCYIYFDQRYPSNYEIPVIPIGARTLDQEYYVQQLAKSLENRGVEAKIIDADKMESIMNNGLIGNSDSIIVISGAFPSNVYDGTNNLVLSWIEAGGRLYWLGNVIGDYYADLNGIKTVEGGVSNFLGADCVNHSEDKDFAYEEYDLCEKMCLMNDHVKYAVAPGQLPLDVIHKEIGFNDGTYSSITLIGLGKGMLCILGGEYSNNQRSDLAQVVASGINHRSILIDEYKGSVNGTVKNSLDILTCPDTAYIFLGGYYLVYGKCIQFN